MFSRFSKSFFAGMRPVDLETWSPSSIEVAGWIDASDSESYQVSSNVISSITDKSGNFSSLQIVGNPRINSQHLNSTDIFYFDGNDAIESNSEEQVVNSGNHWAIGVFKITGIDSNKDSIWSALNSSVSSSSRRDYAVSSSNPNNGWDGEIDLDNNNNIVTGVAKIPWSSSSSLGVNNYFNNWHIFGVIFNKQGDQIFARVDGRTASSISEYDNSLNTNMFMRIMRNRTNRRPQGYLAEWFWVADIPGSGGTNISDFEKAEGYLAHKWGLSSLLPSSHSYKNSPP